MSRPREPTEREMGARDWTGSDPADLAGRDQRRRTRPAKRTVRGPFFFTSCVTRSSISIMYTWYTHTRAPVCRATVASKRWRVRSRVFDSLFVWLTGWVERVCSFRATRSRADEEEDGTRWSSAARTLVRARNDMWRARSSPTDRSCALSATVYAMHCHCNWA